MYLELSHLKKRFGEKEVVQDLSLSLERGELLCILGSSGCGKTTTLNMIGGFLAPDGGTIRLDGQDITALPPERRPVTTVFQSYSLFPHMSVLQNVMYGLKFQSCGKAAAREKGMKYLDMVGLTDYAGARIHEISGGQQQRVALARALVIEPSVLLFDEPLSNLDAKLRVSMRTEIRRIQQRVGITAIYVTHDQSEAMALSDQIIVMKNGVVEQMGTPQEIYYHPKNEFVADFIGEANFLRGTMTGRENGHAVIRVEGHDMPVADRPDMEPGREYTIVLRPEAAHLSDEGGVPCRVSLSCFMGSYQNYHVQLGDIRIALTEYNPQNKRIYNVGEECRLVFEPDEVHVL